MCVLCGDMAIVHILCSNFSPYGVEDRRAIVLPDVMEISPNINNSTRIRVLTWMLPCSLDVHTISYDDRILKRIPTDDRLNYLIFLVGCGTVS